ncbi:MAG: hypothetical protein AAFQ58_22950 [Pseudomonadota bacterium]
MIETVELKNEDDEHQEDDRDERADEESHRLGLMSGPSHKAIGHPLRKIGCVERGLKGRDLPTSDAAQLLLSPDIAGRAERPKADIRPAVSMLRSQPALQPFAATAQRGHGSRTGSPNFTAIRFCALLMQHLFIIAAHALFQWSARR